MNRTYKFRLYPKDRQIVTMEGWLYSLHNLYNAGLQQRIIAYRDNHRSQTYKKQANELPDLKMNLPEYKGIHSQVLQDCFRRLDKSYNNFFSRVKRGEKPGFPRFKSLSRYRSFTYPQSGFKILENGHLFLSGIGEMRMFKHRDVKGTVKTCTIKRDKVGTWWASFSTEMEEPPRREVKNAIGIDMGLEKLLTVSDGSIFNNQRFLKTSERMRKRRQRTLSRKKKGSHNRKKARVKLAIEDRKIENRRNDYLHKVSHDISEKADIIVFENLNIENMLKNHHLAKSILDASWGKLVQYTRYKVEETGGELVLVNPMYTSQTCSKCGAYAQKSLSDRIHICPNCGFVADRDWNASLNILKIGWGTAEFKPVERGVQFVSQTQPFYESGSSLL